jgi:hypothetical protein
MLAAEFAEFEAILRQQAQVFSKKLTDEMVQGYWSALRDSSLPTIRRCSDNHLRFGKFFPKPAELRPRDELPTGVKEDLGFKAAVEQNIRNWDERIRQDPIGGRRALLGAYVLRAEFEDPNSARYSEKQEFIEHARRKIDAMEREQRFLSP